MLTNLDKSAEARRTLHTYTGKVLLSPKQIGTICLVVLISTISNNANATDIGLTWDGDPTTIPTSCTYGGTFVPPTPPARTGYVFTGWKANPPCSVIIHGLDPSIRGTGAGVDEGASRLDGTAGIDEAIYGLTPGSGQWAAKFSYGVVYGMANCNTIDGTRYEAATITPESEGKYCWCQVTGFTPTREDNDYSGGPKCTVSASSWWVLYNAGSRNDCANRCAKYCSNNLRTTNSNSYRQTLFEVAGN